MTHNEGGIVPFHQERNFLTLRDAMNQLFDESFWSPFERSSFGRLSTVMNNFPRVDVAEQDHAIIVTANVPGMRPEDIAIEVHDGVLTISGEMKKEHKEDDKDRRFYRFEREYGSFSRSFSLPVKVDEAAIEAASKDGVLTITLPKSKDEGKRRIAVKVK